jgi:Mg2+ and Co2+ transporter CorA
MDYTDSEQGQYDLQRAEYDEHQKEQLAFEVAKQICDAAFCVLENLEELDGAIAGQIAKAVQDVVEQELRHVL